MAAARLAVTEDLPTPPLPEVTAYTRVRLPGWVKGMTGSAAPPRSRVRSSAFCSSVMTPRCTLTSVTPSTPPTSRRVSSVIVSFRGQPATVSRTPTLTAPDSLISTDSTMPRSVIERWSSGSMTRPRASRTASSVGADMTPS
jgi:hypothetical protein